MIMLYLFCFLMKDEFIQRITQAQVKLTMSERCTLYFRKTKIYRLHSKDGGSSCILSVFRNQQKPRFPVNIGITGYVASTGEAST